MPNLSDIIGQIQRELHCPVCGKKYELGEIKLKGLLENTLIVQTVCVNNHVTLFMTSFRKGKNKTPITANDVISLHAALESFDGDFQSIWNKSL